MTAPTTPNAELAYAVLDQIDAHPELHDQSWWFTITDCGTAGCFAGWACMLSGDKPTTWDDEPAHLLGIGRQASYAQRVDGPAEYVFYRAQDLLELVKNDAQELFAAGNTREDLGRLVAEIFGPRPGGTGCRCDWLGEGTPEHAPSPLCRSLRPDADRHAPGLIEGDTAAEQRDNAYARYEADQGGAA